MLIEDALKVIQIIISAALVFLVVFQAGSSGVGSLFGGSDGGGVTRTRRGLEKTLFQLTIALAILFVVNAILQLIVS